MNLKNFKYIFFILIFFIKNSYSCFEDDALLLESSKNYIFNYAKYKKNVASLSQLFLDIIHSVATYG